MNKKSFFAAAVIIAGYSAATDAAKADDWGCQVILCLSNPGGATQFPECVPPINKLYQQLAKGKPFPTCSGAGYSVSQPRYEPFYCETGVLVGRSTCRSAQKVEVPCPNVNGDDAQTTSETMERIYQAGSGTVCQDFTFSDAKAREKPTYVDVTTERGKQRVWF